MGIDETPGRLAKRDRARGEGFDLVMPSAIMSAVLHRLSRQSPLAEAPAGSQFFLFRNIQ
jgi:hypothetical protein